MLRLHLFIIQVGIRQDGGFMTDRQVTMFFTGAIIRMCDCHGSDTRIYSDGRDEYVSCEKCGEAWKLTGEEGKDL